MSQFTAGPWIHTGAGFIEAANGETITNNEQYYPYLSDNDADFDLIAAAPEMYEALFKIQMLAETSELCADRVPAVTARTLLPLVRAALAKAEGKQP